jgi:hypothetical protein
MLKGHFIVIMNLMILLLALYFPAVLCIEPPTVTLQDLGTVIGSVLQSRENRNIYAFQGIPFAESPTAYRRFQARFILSKFHLNFIYNTFWNS